MTNPTPEITKPAQPLQGLAAYLRAEAGGTFQGSPNWETLLQWASEVDAAALARPQEVAGSGGTAEAVAVALVKMPRSRLAAADSGELLEFAGHILAASRAPVAVGVEPMRQHVEDFATRAGWKREDGEGAFEFVQRKCYAQGHEDTKSRFADAGAHCGHPEHSGCGSCAAPAGGSVGAEAEPVSPAQSKMIAAVVQGDAARLDFVLSAIVSDEAKIIAILHDEEGFPLSHEQMRESIDAARAQSTKGA